VEESILMIIPFNALKVAQAAAVVIKEHDGRISRLRLLKLLYIADRESLAETLRPITGDRPVAMDHGPVLTRTYDLIKSQSTESAAWDRYIQQRGPQDLELIEAPGVGLLSRYEIEKLKDVSARHRSMNDFDISMETHGFEEWIRNQPPKGRSRVIPIDHLLEALNLGSLKSELANAAETELELDQLLGGGAVTGRCQQ
jgi:uncharacterized phage-associated protein